MPNLTVTEIVEQLYEANRISRMGIHYFVEAFVCSLAVRPQALSIETNRIRLAIPGPSHLQQAIEITPIGDIEKVVILSTGVSQKSQISLATFIDQLFLAIIDEIRQSRNFDVAVAALAQIYEERP